MVKQPSRLAEGLLRWIVGGRDAEAIAGDLREDFEALGGGRRNLWYWRQLLSCVAIRLSPHRRVLPGLGQDFHHAFRRLRLNPGYGFTAMLCFALAIGVNSTLFSFLDSLFFQKLPVPEADRITTIRRETNVLCTWQEYLDFRDSLRSVQAAGSLPGSALVDIDGMNLRLVTEAVSANYGKVLRLGTTMGSWFRPEADSSSAEPVVVISYQFWAEKLNRDPEVVGKEILVQEMPYRIVGVAPRSFRGTMPPVAVDLWVPAAVVAPGRMMVDVVARLVPGATLEGAAAEMRLVNERLRSSDPYPSSPRFADPIRVESATGFLWSSGRRSLIPVVPFISGVCAAVLLIACVNVANLLLSRAAVRRHEIAVRRSLGASQARLFQETLAEGLVLAAGGVAMGIIAGYWMGRIIAAAVPSIPVASGSGVIVSLTVDWRVALSIGASAALSAILFSLPAAFENGKRDLNTTLKGEDGRTTGRQRELYLLAQVALSLTLLVSAGLMLRALRRAETADLGFPTDHRLYAVLYASPKSFPPDAARQTFTNVLLQAGRLPGVLDATLASEPLDPGVHSCAAASPAAPPLRIAATGIDPTFFEVMRIPIIKGRGFGAAETAGAAAGVVVNQTMAQTWWPGEDAIGKSFWLGCDKSKRRIANVIGITRDIKYALDQTTKAAFYISRLQDPGSSSLALIIRTAGDPHLWTKPLIATARSVGPKLRIYKVQSLDDAVGQVLWEARWQAAVLAGLGLLAVILAAIGLYGVVAYMVSQRTREIGIRVALGAAPEDVLWMVLMRGLRLTAIGIVFGLLLSAASMRLLQRFLYGLSPFDPAAFLAASLTWVLVAMMACWYPARRATRVDPLTALKYD